MSTAESYSDVLTAVCIWREARGEPSEAWRGVYWVIRNRSVDPRWPNTRAGVVTQPKQFSSFNTDDPNSHKWPAPNDTVFPAICALVDNPGGDPTGGATHYHSPMEHPPSWADPFKQTARLGALVFFKL